MPYIYNTLFLTITIQVVYAEKGPCQGFFNGCCPNTQWSPEFGTCINCSMGYYWINCSRTCTYPYFGNRCLYKCHCAEQSCNFIKGCSIEKEFLSFRRLRPWIATLEFHKGFVLDPFGAFMQPPDFQVFFPQPTNQHFEIPGAAE
ncbi:uncharacterized protein LOC134241067 [Saccostrea cucullata]|uniref:uncharacterized protein LOC134241067 n=1 Tax=Saccostrea cuccullata TaxID=36930 RepID=UPI002ED53C7F